ncbi:MAG: glycosyltransferase family 1 protein [Prosthecochloris sp.]|uniref:glycosyltransferase family 4 protein n=1 Tax=Prosthecochloris sp. TaxID=290513 RepID=UPI0025870270|nr:glycosyltransferase family 1 protein [Prosthecochloris sp.]MCW8798129.1 glycosyltransferase family 1 protein [Prosthecochloris sp.]
MKIAFYAGTYVRDKDGAVRSMYQLVASFVKDGHEVMVWSPDVTSGGSRGETVVQMPAVPIPMYPDYKLGFYSASTSRQLDLFQPDIIHISTPDIIGYNFLKYALKHKLPAGSVYHTDFPSYLSYYHLGFTENLVWKYLRKLYNSCNVLFAPTHEMVHKLQGKGITTVELWSRGIDRDLFRPSRRSSALRTSWGADGKAVIAYVGRFVWYKDIQVVIDVYNRFMMGPHAGKVVFVMIGSGPEEAELRERMPQAIFPGYLTGADLPEAYASSDLLLFPSTTESFGNVTLEAFACGLPAVVSDIGGCRELTEQADGGVIAPAKDADAFYEGCVRLIVDRAFYETMKSNALQFAAERSWDMINAAVIKRYRSLVEGGSGISS